MEEKGGESLREKKGKVLDLEEVGKKEARVCEIRRR
jgi:hypothetical protein